MPAARWRMGRVQSPFRPIPELEELRRRWDEDVVRPVMHAIWGSIPEEVKSWAPAVDVFEKGDHLMIKVELPNMKLEDIGVYVTEDTLTIKGERKPESAVKEDDYFRSEIAYGGFYRTIDLPFSVDTQSIEALYEEGVLRVTLQRAAGSKPKRVTVQVRKSTA